MMGANLWRQAKKFELSLEMAKWSGLAEASMLIVFSYEMRF